MHDRVKVMHDPWHVSDRLVLLAIWYMLIQPPLAMHASYQTFISHQKNTLGLNR